MSVDTRTLRTPTGDRPSGFDDEPYLSMAKVPSDPAQVIVNHASFRVRLATPVGSRVLAATAPAAASGPSVPRRRAPVVWSGRTEAGDPAPTTQLLLAVRDHGPDRSAPVAAEAEPAAAGAVTQLLPRIDDAAPATVIGPRAAEPPPEPPYGARSAGHGGTADDGRAADPGDREPYTDDDTMVIGALSRPAGEDPDADPDSEARTRRPPDDVRHAFYPGRRMNLGVVLLPLRVFLGFISIYAGMGKLCDPVYFDGGERGSMVTWLRSLHPWAIATPLRDFALAHPVGAGLTVAFLQIVVGVLTVLGLWQRVAACFGALLSAALIVTVSWRTVPAYDAPDIIYLAAWSPLVIAGAPVYSMDGRLATEAWRRLGPRVGVAELRRRVLRRGAVTATVVVGLTLLIGSLLGGAVRSSHTVRVPGPSEPPRNNLPGSPLPRHSGEIESSQPGTPSAPGEADSPSADGDRSAGPSASASGPAAPDDAEDSGSTGGYTSVPSRSQGQGTTDDSAGADQESGGVPRGGPPQAPTAPSGGDDDSGGGADSEDTQEEEDAPASGDGGGRPPGALGGLLG